MSDFENNESDVVIVGAGPIGLLMAIGLLFKNPKQRIVLLEKYAEYQRSHVIRVKEGLLIDFARECHAENHPRLQALIQQIKQNAFIKTKFLEEQLRLIALELGAQIKTTDMRNITSDVYASYPNAQLIIGADGTHSTVSTQVFGEENTVKYPFDYVLQLRFEVVDEAVRMDRLDSIKFMQSYGVVASEYIGKINNGKTPITLQIMISKEEFDELYPHATSKHPLLPFHDKEANLDKIPKRILQTLNGYMGLRLRHYTKEHQTLFLSDARLSVNEAPATHARHVALVQDAKMVILTGDAALGLSYFKGFNAGLESVTKLVHALAYKDSEKKARVAQYAHWFEKQFAPSKVNEVRFFSHYVVRPAMHLFYWLNQLVNNNVMMTQDECDRTITLYRQHQRELSLLNTNNAPLPSWTPYPHREDIHWNPVLTFIPSSIQYTKQYRKYFTDWLKPYKSVHYLIRDLNQPLRIIYYLGLGALKIALALPVFALSSLFHWLRKDDFSQIKDSLSVAIARIKEGLAEIGLGIFLIATIPLFPLKAFIRTMLSLNSKAPNIEQNTGIKKIIEYAEKPDLTSYAKLALCVDLHRKFEKSRARMQSTTIDIECEHRQFQKCLTHDTNAYNDYFNLFKCASNSGATTPPSEHPYPKL